MFTAARNFLVRRWSALTTHIATWQEVWFWLPVVMVGVIYFHYFVKQVDPMSGSDGLGALQGYAMLGVQGVLSCILAFFIKKTYFGVLPLRVIRDLREQVLLGNGGAQGTLNLDRLEWVACLLFGYFIFAG